MPTRNIDPEVMKKALFQGWLKKAETTGDAMACFNAGIGLLNGLGTERDERRAVELFTKAAGQGLSRAQYQLGMCLLHGVGVESKDAEKALENFVKAAEQGEASAQFAAGVCLANGDGCIRNDEDAFQWYLKAAEQGHVGAMVNLGLCYYKGLGVRPSENQALHWLKQAAEAGDQEAIDLFAAMQAEKEEEARARS